MGNERLVVKQRMFEGGDRFDYFSQTNRLDKVTSHEGAKPPNKILFKIETKSHFP